jgi:outer membrane protein OmpA-like peptidoglycan-associated protein
MKNKLGKALALWLFAPFSFAQAQIPLEGYVFETNNRGYLNQVKITVYELPDNTVRAEMESDAGGYFACSLPQGRYRVSASKDIFFERNDTLRIGPDKVFLKMEMRRRPGYLFDATIAEARETPDQIVDAIAGARVEIYNRTQGRSELVLVDRPDAFFQHTFERGNHYTLLIRKPGYLAKRIEVYVNVRGCILCVDGVRNVSPGVTENLTAGNEMGTLLANIELERAKLDKRIQIQNIYYDYDKWDIRPDAAPRLDNVVTLMQDNPGLSVELGSHTDSRGNDDYNLLLSQRRAAAAVAYIVSQGIDSLRITARGYGESQLANRCRNSAECSEAEHQQNRRTELRITGITGETNAKPLEQIVREEEAQKLGKDQKPRDRQLPEANNSVKLPPAQVEFAEKEGVEIASPAPRTSSTSATARPAPESSARLLALPPGFLGYAAELAQSDAPLAPEAPAFRGQKEIFWEKTPSGKFHYYLVNLGSNRDKVRDFFNKKIKPNNPTARLVLFGKTGKEYLN